MTEQEAFAAGYQEGAKRVADFFAEMMARDFGMTEAQWRQASDIILADCAKRYAQPAQGSSTAEMK